MKTACVLTGPVMFKLQTGPWPAHAPVHDEKLLPVPAMAVSWSVAPVGNDPEQVVPQLMAPPVEMTFPLPAFDTVTVW